MLLKGKNEGPSGNSLMLHFVGPDFHVRSVICVSVMESFRLAAVVAVMLWT